MKIVPVNDSALLKAVGCYLKRSTLYDYHHKRKHPEWFLKIGKKLFLRVNEWQRYVRGELAESMSQEEIDEIMGRMEDVNG